MCALNPSFFHYEMNVKSIKQKLSIQSGDTSQLLSKILLYHNAFKEELGKIFLKNSFLSKKQLKFMKIKNLPDRQDVFLFIYNKYTFI